MKVKSKNWPVEEGRYKVGNYQSPVAVCTEATVEGIEVDLKKVAIIGKCVTENVGIEKIVKNIVSNPNIRFLILCGRESRGHDVGQTIVSLAVNGVDGEKRIVGSTGSIPLVKHLSLEEISRFRKQILPVEMFGETNSGKIGFKVETLRKIDPGSYTGQPLKIKKLDRKKEAIKCLKAVADPEEETKPDPKGFFQIFIDEKENLIIARHYNNNSELDYQVNGREALSLTDTIIRNNLIGKFSQSLNHAAYLARELQKAEICLKNGWPYNQDGEVISGQKEKLKKLKEDEFGW